ncbi:MAG: thioredoxin family protein [Pirellulales bacterium]
MILTQKFAVGRRSHHAACFVTLAALIVAGCGEANKQAANTIKPADAAKPAGEAVRWLTNLDEAKKVAAAEGKDLLIIFTGSSWCGPCKQLENEVLSRAEFAPTAEHFVLVKLDYPPGVRRLPQEPADSPVSWSDYYCGGGMPGVFLADTTGKPYATTGNMGLEAQAYREHIEKLRGVHGKRDEAFAKAAAAVGIERAKYLADGLKTLRNAIEEDYRDRNNDPLFRFYRREIDEVLRLDADGAAGLRGPIDRMLAESNGEELNAFYALLDKTYSEQGLDAALKMLDDKLAATTSIKLRNDLQQVRRNLLEQSDRFKEALAVSRELARDDSRTADDRFTDRKRMAWNLWRLNRQEESLALYDELFAASARYPWRLWALARDQADSFQYSEQFAEALSTWDQVIPRLEPRSDLLNEALLSRSRLLARLGRADDAWADFDRRSAEGWWEPIDPVAAMLLIAEGLNEHGSRDAALAAAARAEKALNELAAAGRIETNTIALLRLKLEKVKAGPATTATPSRDPPTSEDSKK